MLTVLKALGRAEPHFLEVDISTHRALWSELLSDELAVSDSLLLPTLELNGINFV